MKTPVTITNIHVDAAYTTDRLQGDIKVSVEIDGQWVEIMHEQFDPSGFHVSHIIGGSGVETRRNAQLLKLPIGVKPSLEKHVVR